MHNKYNKKLILDYVTGNDLGDYDIEELEDNPDFMADVMEFTMDKRMYCLCSDMVKRNHTFVKRIIKKFKNDYEFIIEIADNYISDNDNSEINKAEINILIGNIFDESKNFDLTKYKLAARAFYESFDLVIKYGSDYLDESGKKILGKGFCLAEETYAESKIIKDYFAKCMLEEILFDDSKYNFEELLHIYFKRREDLERYGETNFLISYLENQDYALSNYICRNRELISDVKKEIIKIKKDWSNYIERINKEKIDMIWDEVYRYQENHFIFYGLDYTQCLDEVMRELGILDLLGIASIEETIQDTMDDIEDISDDEMINSPDEEQVPVDEYEELKCPIIEKSRFVNYMTSYIKMLFQNDIIKESTNEMVQDHEKDKIEKENPKCKIIKINFKPNPQ